jgi:hypothetical protein
MYRFVGAMVTCFFFGGGTLAWRTGSATTGAAVAVLPDETSLSMALVLSVGVGANRVTCFFPEDWLLFFRIGWRGTGAACVVSDCVRAVVGRGLPDASVESFGGIGAAAGGGCGGC